VLSLVDLDKTLDRVVELLVQLFLLKQYVSIVI
jgi:hypothetical protein